MILSVSRRTDIPSWWAGWFLARVHAGFAYVRSPMNARQISRIVLSPEVVDCIVFWTKNPTPLLPRLDELEAYPYYFQFTITGYGPDIEPGLPDKKQVVIPAFLELSRRLGPKRVIWRYDPILFNSRYTPEYHLRAFREIAVRLEGSAQRAVMSFVDLYPKIRRTAAALGIREPDRAEMLRFSGELAAIAMDFGFTLESCAEAVSLQPAGIRRGSCIDKALIEEITGFRLKASKDKAQRPACGCLESVDIGAYNTCRSGCRYCYAAFGQKLSPSPDSPLLGGVLGPEDVVTDRLVRSHRETQSSLF